MPVLRHPPMRHRSRVLPWIITGLLMALPLSASAQRHPAGSVADILQQLEHQPAARQASGHGVDDARQRILQQAQELERQEGCDRRQILPHELVAWVHGDLQKAAAEQPDQPAEPVIRASLRQHLPCSRP